MRILTALRAWAVAALVCLPALGLLVPAGLVLSGCSGTLECGSWAFNGTPQSNPDQFPLTSAFTFTPATCGKSCQCDSDVMIQMIWVFDVTDKTYLYPTSSYQARATAYGRVIDRVDGAANGYYGLLNDGTFASFWNTPGSNGTATTLIDNPGGWPDNTWFFALDVPVCFTSNTCKNRILGYFVWSWIIDENGNASKFIIEPAWDGLNTDFQDALTAWNNWAPTSGQENDGHATLPHAVAFPALSDL